MRILVTGAGTPGARALAARLEARGARVLEAGPDPAPDAFAAADRAYHITGDFDPDAVARAQRAFSMARAAGLELIGWQSRLGPYDLSVAAGRDLAAIHERLLHSGVPFFVAQPAWPLEWLEDWTPGWRERGLLRTPLDPDAVVPWIGCEDLAAAATQLLLRPRREGGTYELCRFRSSVRELAGSAGVAAVERCAAGDVAGLSGPESGLAREIHERLSRGLNHGNPAMLERLCGGET